MNATKSPELEIKPAAFRERQVVGREVTPANRTETNALREIEPRPVVSVRFTRDEGIETQLELRQENRLTDVGHPR
jgi:hypothetical protein